MRRRSPRTSLQHEPGGQYVVIFTDASGQSHARRFDTKREARWFRRAIRELPRDEPFDENELERLVADYTGLFTRNVGREMARARLIDSSK